MDLRFSIKDKNDVVLVNKQVVLGGAQFWPKPKFSGIRWFLKRLHKEAAVEVSNYCLVHTVIKGKLKRFPKKLS